jgi:hypothetical protein
VHLLPPKSTLANHKREFNGAGLKMTHTRNKISLEETKARRVGGPKWIYVSPLLVIHTRMLLCGAACVSLLTTRNDQNLPRDDHYCDYCCVAPQKKPRVQSFFAANAALLSTATSHCSSLFIKQFTNSNTNTHIVNWRYVHMKMEKATLEFVWLVSHIQNTTSNMSNFWLGKEVNSMFIL